MPAKGINCKHINYFCLYNFLEMYIGQNNKN